MTDLTQAAEIARGLDLFRKAEQDWEFYDASPAFRAFASWCEDHLESVLKAHSGCHVLLFTGDRPTVITTPLEGDR